jgi:hypothetical protein
MRDLNAKTPRAKGAKKGRIFPTRLAPQPHGIAAKEHKDGSAFGILGSV